jgi:hypothetical protein
MKSAGAKYLLKNPKIWSKCYKFTAVRTGKPGDKNAD